MTDLPKRKDQIYITRSHILAISITTLSIVILTFSLGYKTGLSQAAPPPVAQQKSLLPDVNQQDTLEELLRQIEHSYDDSKSNDYMFPNETETPELPTPSKKKKEPAPPSTIRSAKADEPVTAKKINIQLPSSGWAVQLASYKTLDEAKESILNLHSKGLSAYYVKGEVEGKTWHRVRVGGYRTKQLATQGKSELMELLGGTDYVVKKAP